MTNPKNADQNIQTKWKTTGDVRASLAEQLKRTLDGKADHKETEAIMREARKVNKKLKEQLESEVK